MLKDQSQQIASTKNIKVIVNILDSCISQQSLFQEYSASRNKYGLSI